MVNAETDRVHQIRDELVRFGLISSDVKIVNKNFSKSKSSAKASFLGKKIIYESEVNKASDEKIVWILGHEYGHIKLPQYSTLVSALVLVFVIIFPKIIIPWLNTIIVYTITIFLLSAVLTTVLTIVSLSKWLQEDENRSDITGTMILLEYGNKIGKKVIPSEIMKEFHDAGKPLIHPPKDERIKKIKEFEKFYYSKNIEKS